MKCFCRRLLAGGGGLLLSLALLVTASPAAGAQGSAPTHDGQSYAVGLTGVKALGKVVRVDDVTLPQGVILPSGGGVQRRALGTILLPGGLGSAVVAQADAQGDGNQSNARSEVASVTLLPAGVPSGVSLPVRPVAGAAVLDAHVLTASASVDCSGDVLHHAAVADLKILGQPVDVSPGGRAQVTLGDKVVATVSTSDQTGQASGGTVQGSSSALVVDFPTDGAIADVIQGTITLAHAEAGVSGCAPTSGGGPGPGGGSGPGAGGGQPGFPGTGAPSRLDGAGAVRADSTR